LADFPIGVAVGGRFFNTPEMQNTVLAEFNQVTAENIMKMSYLHPAENTYTFDQADQLVNWANANGIGVHGHTFIWHPDYQVPGWMRDYSGDFEDMLNDHVTTIAEHFAGRVDSWDVVNEVIDPNNNCWRDTLFYQQVGEDFVENAFRAAHAADPNADLYYNDYDTEGGNSTKLACLVSLVEDLLEENVPIDGVGFQMHVQLDWPSTSAIAAAFKSIVDLGLKVKVTELDVPLNNPYSSVPFPQYTAFTEAAAEAQKQRYKAIMETYLEVVPPAQRGGLSVWGIWDGDSWLLDFDAYQGVLDWPLLFNGPANGPYQPKPAYDGLVEALTAP